MIRGIGIDVVDVARFERQLTRTPQLAGRLFDESELRTARGQLRSPASLAARFAAKEALAKSLGAPGNLQWHDAVVITDAVGAPSFQVSGTVAQRMQHLQVTSLLLSLSHDAGIATAIVLAQ